MTGYADHGNRVTGLNYIKFLRNLHERLRPKTYLEIGVYAGAALTLADCASIAIDPRFHISTDVIGRKPLCLMFQETSDRFFERHDPTSLFGQPVEMAFLDGLHLFEFLLRDFINVERHCRANSVILLHDCLPPHFSMTARDASALSGRPAQYGDWWTGDVWKLIPVLRKYRPDLSVELVDCKPTGLTMITNLNPESRVLQDAYGDIVGQNAAEANDAAQFDRYWAGLTTTPSSSLMTAEQLAARYWL